MAESQMENSRVSPILKINADQRSMLEAVLKKEPLTSISIFLRGK